MAVRPSTSICFVTIWSTCQRDRAFGGQVGDHPGADGAPAALSSHVRPVGSNCPHVDERTDRVIAGVEQTMNSVRNRSGPSDSLLVALDHAFRSHRGIVGREPGFSTGPTLTQQIPALIERDLEFAHPLAILVARELALGGSAFSRCSSSTSWWIRCTISIVVHVDLLVLVVHVRRHVQVDGAIVAAPARAGSGRFRARRREWIRSDAMRLNAVRRGSGAPIVFIHGLGMSAASWNACMDLLDDRFTVVAIDLLGHGQSPVPEDPAEYTRDRALDDIDDVLSELLADVETPAVLVGHSLGGYLALGLRRDPPRRDARRRRHQHRARATATPSSARSGTSARSATRTASACPSR